MVFVGQNLLQRRCIHCETERFFDVNLPADISSFPDVDSYSHLTPKAVDSYIPIIPRLKVLYAHPDSASKMRYPKGLLNEPWDGLRDVWDGNGMMHLRAAGTISCYFS
jgi:hypothetical protein